jgi:hypothetical protein
MHLDSGMYLYLFILVILIEVNEAAYIRDTIRPFQTLNACLYGLGQCHNGYALEYCVGFHVSAATQSTGERIIFLPFDTVSLFSLLL